MFSFIQITDHHLRESETLLTRGYSTWHAFRAVMRHIAQQHTDVDFIVTTGDLVDGGTDVEYQHARRMLGITETSDAPGPQRVSIEGLRDMPMYFLPGNHDARESFFRNMFPPSTTLPFAQDTSPPAMNVAFMHKGVQFVCVDWGAANKAVSTHAMYDLLARVLRRRSINAAQDADAREPTIILTHHHVTPTGMAYIDSFLAADVATFAEAIRGRNVLAIFNGHTHATYEAQLAGVPVYGLRSTMFSFTIEDGKVLAVLRPPHYRVVTMDEGKVRTEIVEVAL